MANSSTAALITGTSCFLGLTVVRALLARIAGHKMFGSSAKGVRALGYRRRPAEKGRKDACRFGQIRMCR